MLHSVIGNTADFGSAIEESYSSGATIKNTNKIIANLFGHFNIYQYFCKGN